MSLWEGSIPDYLTGIGTLVLAVATAAVLWRDRAIEKRRALRDARKVFATAVERDLPGVRQREVHTMQAILVVNAGSDPIFKVGAGSFRKDDGTERSRLAWLYGVQQVMSNFVLPNGQECFKGTWVEMRPFEDDLEDDLSASADEADDDDDLDWRPAELLYWMYPQLPVVVTWTDGRGARWERRGNDEPRRFPTNDPDASRLGRIWARLRK